MRRAYFNLRKDEFVIGDNVTMFATHSKIEVPPKLFPFASKLAEQVEDVTLEMEGNKYTLKIAEYFDIDNNEMLVSDTIVPKANQPVTLDEFHYPGQDSRFTYEGFKLFSLFRENGNMICSFIQQNFRILFVRGNQVDLERGWEKILPPIANAFSCVPLKFHIDHEKILFETPYDTSKLVKVFYDTVTNKVTVQQIES